MKNIVVYTVLVGGYDIIQQPDIVCDEVDYICFTDYIKPEVSINGVWKMVEIPFQHEDKGRLSRFPKLLPHETIISEYDYSLYIDANIIIKGKFVYDKINDLINRQVRLALIKHPARDCVYQEAYTCLSASRVKWSDLFRQIFFLKIHRFPKHWGLYEANVIFRRHNDEQVKSMDSLWWKIFMKYSKRDQLSLVYALKATDITIEFFLPEGYSTSNHDSFQKTEHKAQLSTNEFRMKRFVAQMIPGIIKRSFLK